MKARRTLHIAASLIPVVVVVAVAVAVHYALREFRYSDLRSAIHAIPRQAILESVLLTAFSYFLMTCYDTLAFRYVHKNLPYSKIAFTSFIGYTLSNNIGYSFLSGGSIRYRFYSGWGLTPAEIFGVITFCTVTGWLGFMTLAGSSSLLEPTAVLEAASLPPAVAHVAGILLILFPIIYLGAAILGRETVSVGKWSIRLPNRRLAVTQWGLGVVDFSMACAALYVLLPAHPGLSFAGFLGLFMISLVAGIASQMPGGLGVFEGAMTLLLASRIPPAQALSALVVFRLIYYVFPLCAGLAVLTAYEIRRRRRYVSRLYSFADLHLYPLVPHLFVVSVFVCGIILLVSGATPATEGRMKFLRDFLPLPVIEMSHFLASMAGLGMLLLARALQHRVKAAYWLTCGLLGAGVVFSLLKGFDYEEAIILSLMLAALIPSHRHFRRKARLFSQVTDPRWLAAVAAATAGSIWLGIFVHRHVEYTGDVWWRFSFNADAPRFLRASVGLVIGMVALVAARLLRSTPIKPAPPTAEDREAVRELVKQAQNVQANLALLPDKQYLFNDDKTGFIMYGMHDRAWVSMGDPVAPDAEKADLVWRFREACDASGAWPVFYEVRPAFLPLYIDAGLLLYKLGEEARVPLESFSLEGSSHKSDRNLLHKLDREAYEFTVLSRDEVAPLLPELREISDQWLAQKNVREKGFSLGRFDPQYLLNFPHAIVRKEGKTIAFANVWQGGGREEVSPDLMRYLPGEHGGVIDFLFLNMMLWAKQEAYRWFNLGMAPLAGLETYGGATLWNRLGVLMYRHGEMFYNFQGLRKFKEKFDPVWEPRYLASPKHVLLPTVLVDTAALISGGIAGIVSK